MRLRVARKIADRAAPGHRHPGRRPARRWRSSTLVRAFLKVHKKWRAVTEADIGRGDHFDAGRHCTEDFFRGNRLSWAIERQYGIRVEHWKPKPAIRRNWIEKHGRFP
jgi:hypothetical protein